MPGPGVETQLQGERAQLVIPPGAGQSLPAQQVAQRWSEPSPTPPFPALPAPRNSSLTPGLASPRGEGKEFGGGHRMGFPSTLIF